MGELEVSGEDQQEVDTYFDTANFAFHGPDGFDADYAGLTAYFESVRAAFDDHGRLIEEFVRTDYRSFLRQLGAEGA